MTPDLHCQDPRRPGAARSSSCLARRHPPSAPCRPSPARVQSVAPILQQATSAVVNIAIRGQVRERNPLFQDPFFRRFFDLLEVVEREVHPRGRASSSTAGRATS